MHSAATAFDDEQEPPVRRLSRAEAAELRGPRAGDFALARGASARCWSASPSRRWCSWLTGEALLTASALYGAAVVAVPGALMARGATSRLGTISPLTSTVNIMGWATVKIVVSVVMLALASRIVPGLHWPVMLATLVVCMQTYAFALLWRGRGKTIDRTRSDIARDHGSRSRAHPDPR